MSSATTYRHPCPSASLLSIFAEGAGSFANFLTVRYNAAKRWPVRPIAGKAGLITQATEKPMARNSFQEQLLKLGLVKQQQVREAKKEQHHKKKQQVAKSAPPPVDENALLAQQLLEKKKERARQLNLEREAKLQKRAEEARIRQLLEEHKLEKSDKGVAYRFTVEKTIHRVFVSKETADGLSRGMLDIVVLGGQCEIVPRAVALKMQGIDPALTIIHNTPGATDPADPDDPYAAYQVPDDLMW